MKRSSIKFLATSAFFVLPAFVAAQGTGGTGVFSGTIPATFSITDNTNSTLSSAALGSFSTLTVGKNVLNAPTPVSFRMRSNAPYTLTAQVGSLVGMSDGAPTAAGTTAQDIKTGDIGFGFTATINQNGASVVNGGASPSRVDTVATGFDASAGWPTPTDGRSPGFSKTLHDIYSSATQILSGDRISASGDNSSSDNYVTVTVGVATLPQYLSVNTGFSGTVTFTIAGT